MNAKEYLERVRAVEGDLERAMGCIERCEKQLDLQGVPYGVGPSSDLFIGETSPGIVELMKYRESLAAIQSRYIGIEAEADFVIGSLSNPARRRALALRYLDNLTFREIGERMGYSTEGARNLCASGVRDLDAVLNGLLQHYLSVTTGKTLSSQADSDVPEAIRLLVDVLPGEAV